MPKLDYQLKHQLFGRVGSLWESQVDDETRTRVRGIVKAAGNAPVLTQLDTIAAGSLNSDLVLVEDVYFRFVDGNFATVGRPLRDYDHVEGAESHVGYRPESTTASTTPIPHELAAVSADFLDSIGDDAGQLPVDRDWYLVPVPRDIIPIMIEGRGDGEFLVSGIDFLVRDGYIVLTDDPAAVLPIGLVRVTSAYQRVFSPNSFVLSAPEDRKGTRWLSEYAYKTQSVSAFKRAAAEFAGLYVFQEADVILAVHLPTATTTVYVCANAGTVVIDYPHIALTRNQEISPGTIVSGRFEVVASSYNSTENLNKSIAEGWDEPLSLDGIFPENGMTWDGKSQIYVDSVETDPTTSKPHLRFHFGETLAFSLAQYWEWQLSHERQTGEFLYDGLGSPSLPTVVDFWDLLETFYGPRLLLVLAADHTPTINERLRRFLFEHRPASTNMLVSLKATYPAGGVARDSYGNPLVDSDGDYIPSAPVSTCLPALLSVGGHVLAHTSQSLVNVACQSENPVPQWLWSQIPDGYVASLTSDGLYLRTDGGAIIVIPEE